MEDAATAEISRSQVWQWVHNGVVLDTGRTRDRRAGARHRRRGSWRAIAAEIGSEAFAASRYELARSVFEEVALADDFADFLTLPAYEAALRGGPAAPVGVDAAIAWPLVSLYEEVLPSYGISYAIKSLSSREWVRAVRSTATTRTDALSAPSSPRSTTCSPRPTTSWPRCTPAIPGPVSRSTPST